MKVRALKALLSLLVAHATVSGVTGGEGSWAADRSLEAPRVGSPITLVRGGRPLGEIVVLPERQRAGWIDSEVQAAEALQEWVERMTGVELPVVEKTLGGPALVLGRAAVAAGLELGAIDSPSREAVRVLTRGNRVLMAGQEGVSPLRVAAVFLEALGCRWYIEGELGKQCPEAVTLVVPPLDLTVRPGFRYRRIWGGEGWGRPTPWKIWNGAGGTEFPMRHDWQYVREEEFDSHPEWFRMDASGRRVRGPWLNTGHEELRRVFAERLVADLTSGGHRSISPPDNHQMDWSPESRRYDDPESIEPSSGRISMSNRFMSFASDIARRVGEEVPEAVLSFYAYSDYSAPPTLVDRLEPNLCIWIAPIRYSRFHPIGSPLSASSRRLAQTIDGWARVARLLGYRGYNYNLAESLTPFSKLSVWQHDMPYLRERGFVGVSLESFPSWDLSAPTLWLSLRLAYDPATDAEALRDDFFEGFYRSAAAPMRAYWLDIDAAWSGLETDSGSIYSLHLVWTPERLTRLDRLLSAAETAAAGDLILEARVAMARLGYRHAVDFMVVRDALRQGDVETAMRVYERWLERAQESTAAGTGHVYTERYLRRFVGRSVGAAYAAIHPEGGRPRRVIGVLPDRMRFAYEGDLPAEVGESPAAPEFDDSGWREVRTFGATLDQQGYPDRFEVMWYRTGLSVDQTGRRLSLFASGIDGLTSVFVNGERVGGEYKPLQPFLVDIADAVKPGVNVLAFRVDHRQLAELALGGIVRPVLVLDEPGAS